MIKSKAFLLTGMITLIGGATAHAAQTSSWLFLGTTTGGEETLFYDTKSITHNGETVTVWLKIDASKDNASEERGSKSHWRINCRQKIMGVISGVRYFANGETKSVNPGQNFQYSPIIPGTLVDALSKLVCKIN